MDARAIGRRIKRLREAKGIGQTELARRIGITQKSLWRIEEGETADPGVSKVLAAARALGVPVTALLDEQEFQDVLRRALQERFGLQAEYP